MSEFSFVICVAGYFVWFCLEGVPTHQEGHLVQAGIGYSGAISWPSQKWSLVAQGLAHLDDTD